MRTPLPRQCRLSLKKKCNIDDAAFACCDPVGAPFETEETGSQQVFFCFS